MLASEWLLLFPVRAQLCLTHLLGSQQARGRGSLGRSSPGAVTDRLSGRLTSGWELGSWADRRAAQSPGGLALVMDALRPLLPLLCLPCPPPNFHPAFLSSPWSVASGAGEEEPADSLGGDAGRRRPSVHESARLWRSCQLETTQRHLEYVPWGHCARKEGGCRDQTDLASNPGATTHQLCDLRQATRLRQASVSSSVKWG